MGDNDRDRKPSRTAGNLKTGRWVTRDAKTGQFTSVRETARTYQAASPHGGQAAPNSKSDVQRQVEVASGLIEQDKDILAALAK